jgi:hypothetical protein
MKRLHVVDVIKKLYAKQKLASSGLLDHLASLKKAKN